MTEITKKQQTIIALLLEKGALQSSAVHAELVLRGEEASLVTVKRALSEMAEDHLLEVSGAGRNTHYEVGTYGRLFADVDSKQYCSIEPDKRYGMEKFNFDLLRRIPFTILMFPEAEVLDAATSEYEQRISDIPPAIQKKELERLVIELAWKSSKIEGNTYTLLDTEKLILEHKEAVGHSKEEAVMILNHKYAFDFIHKNSDEFMALTVSNLEELHKILVKDLHVGFGLREKPVGVVGSKYRPIDNIHQIREAVEDLATAIARVHTPYAKALLALVGISYIQPFEDGNKRTGRLMANALLLAHGCAPLSYRSVDENEYREAMLVFYEINSIIPMKKIFIQQYDFAARNYAVQ
ncbi:MAG TPA: Fic family protein [Candidatus Andersenbacteria bacterium]|nr:Fic family protein [Candidatus Andersenbacteria bacterium]